MEVFTEEWGRRCCERLNQRDGYREEAADWEGAVVLVMSADPDAGVPEDRGVWLDVHHGACRGTRVATAADLASAPYVFRAGPEDWRLLLTGEMEVVAGVVKGALRLERGNLFTLARYTAAAREMVLAAGEAGGTFPQAAGA
jgi:putative sterol carrier protein